MDTDWTGEEKPHCLVSQQDNFDQIYLWHHRLGHPRFTLLKKLFPKLFQKIDVSNLHCESCMFTKHHRSIFPIKRSQISTPFS